MSLKPYFFILFIIFLSSALSSGLLFFYLNPEIDTMIAFGLMAFALFLSGTSFLSLALFFLKKVYYRGEVTFSTMNASIRQALLLTVGVLMMALLGALSIYELNLVLMVWAAIGCLEIMIQTLE